LDGLGEDRYLRIATILFIAALLILRLPAGNRCDNEKAHKCAKNKLPHESIASKTNRTIAHAKILVNGQSVD
jgi:hypothetical protein